MLGMVLQHHGAERCRIGSGTMVMQQGRDLLTKLNIKVSSGAQGLLDTMTRQMTIGTVLEAMVKVNMMGTVMVVEALAMITTRMRVRLMVMKRWMVMRTMVKVMAKSKVTGPVMVVKAKVAMLFSIHPLDKCIVLP